MCRQHEPDGRGDAVAVGVQVVEGRERPGLEVHRRRRRSPRRGSARGSRAAGRCRPGRAGRASASARPPRGRLSRLRRQASSAARFSATGPGSSARSSVCRMKAYRAHIDRATVRREEQEAVVEVLRLSPRERGRRIDSWPGERVGHDVPSPAGPRARRPAGAPSPGRHASRPGPPGRAGRASPACSASGATGQDVEPLLPRSGRGSPARRARTGRRRRPARRGIRATRRLPSLEQVAGPLDLELSAGRRTRA